MLSEYRPLGSSALWCSTLLVIHGLVLIVSIVFTFAEIDLLSRIERGDDVPNSEATASDDRMQMIGFVYIGSLILAGIVFIFWMHRAYKNLESLTGLLQDHSPWWVIFGWIIPIISLFRPYQLMGEIDRRSSANVWPLLLWWWGAWLVSSWISGVVGTLFLGGETAGDFITADYFAIFSDVVALIALALALALVHRVTSNQKAKHEAKSGNGSLMTQG